MNKSEYSFILLENGTIEKRLYSESIILNIARKFLIINNTIKLCILIKQRLALFHTHKRINIIMWEQHFHI